MKRKGKAPALYATGHGESVSDALLPFDFSSLDYTRLIEDSLDDITQGKMPPRDLLSKSYADLKTHWMPCPEIRPPSPARWTAVMVL
jgi:Topoisomerase IA